jgi:phosphate transport system substrate-binding protein
MRTGILLAAGLALLLCSDPAAGEDLVIPGTGACEVLLRDLAAAFNTRNPGAEVRVPPSIGSVGGKRVVAKGEYLLGRIARVAGEKEPVAGLKYLPFARDAVIFGVGARVTVRDLSSPQLVAILQGKISRWQEVGGRDAPLRLLVRQPGDVILAAVRGYLNLEAAAFPPEAKIVHHDLEMVAMLQKYENSLGMLTRSSIHGVQAGIGFLEVDHLSPTPENVAAGKYKPAIEYGLIFKNHLDGLAREFINFIFSADGRDVMRPHGVIPLEQR